MTQTTAGWLLILASGIVLGGGFAVRAWIKRDISDRQSSQQDNDDSDKQLDEITLLISTVLAFMLLGGALFLLGFDSIGTQFTFFEQP